MAELLGIATIGIPMLVLVVLMRRSREAPPPEGLEFNEALFGGLEAWAEIDGLKPNGRGYAYLTDRRIVWTPRLNSWQVRSLRSGLPYTEPVIIGLHEIRRVSMLFELGGSRLRVETEDLVLVLTIEARSFSKWRTYIVANAPGLVPVGQPLERRPARYDRSEFLQASRPFALLIAGILALYGLWAAAGMLQLLDSTLTSGQMVALLLSGLLLAGGYVLWTFTRHSE